MMRRWRQLRALKAIFAQSPQLFCTYLHYVLSKMMMMKMMMKGSAIPVLIFTPTAEY